MTEQVIRSKYFIGIFFFLLEFFGVFSQRIYAENIVSNEQFYLEFSDQGVTSLKRFKDSQNIEFIRPNKTLGIVEVNYRVKDGEMQRVCLTDPVCQVNRPQEGCSFTLQKKCSGELDLKSRFVLDHSMLVWQITLENISDHPIEILDLVLPLNMNTVYEKGISTEEIFTRRLFKHAHIAGYGSFVFWLPVSGTGTLLVMLPDEKTHLEYFEQNYAEYARGGGTYRVYIHSAIDGGQKLHGTWRQSHTSLKLAPGEKKIYGFRFLWANSYDDIREILYQNGGLDIRIAPGMVVPEDLPVQFALRTRNTIQNVMPEFSKESQVKYLGKKEGGYYIYEAKFSKLGENLLTVYYGDRQSMPMEFFVTQPLETIIKKRASFIVKNQQHRNMSKWYDGLFSLWDVRKESGLNLLGPDNLGGQHLYAVSGSDDPSSGKPIFLSEKNVVYPDPEEIAALEYYLEQFSWGKHQRTEQEFPYPYGIYGSEHWKENREAKRDPIEKGICRPGPGGSQCRMWRTFDYTHYILLYYNMYKIALQNPDLVKYQDSAGYLERAFGTAKAFFEVPYNIYMEGGWAFTGWTDWAYKQGNFHEKYILKLIEALDKEGQQEKADYLRSEWEKKVKYFLYDDPYPFVSEMPVDSTAYESSYAIAKYALTHDLKPDKNLWWDKNAAVWYSHSKIDREIHKAFMKSQLAANLACRGWLETSYYHLGSDFRASGSGGYCLSYMSQMGGWAILDYALEFAEDPSEYLRLGYASLMSSWALVNSGDEESNYGYWFPGKLHDGTAGWGFCPQKVGQEWNRGCWDKEAGGVQRGIWPVCGEIDHGLTAGVEAACTIVYEDPIFGMTVYGGTINDKKDRVEVYTCDGVRQRFYFIRDGVRLHVFLDRDGFDMEKPVMIFEGLEQICFQLESRNEDSHKTRLAIQGLPRGSYKVLVDSKTLQTLQINDGQEAVCTVPVSAGTKVINVTIRKE